MGDPPQIAFYKNAFGKFDASVSQKISQTEFERETAAFNSQIVSLPLQSFSSYGKTAQAGSGNMPEVYYDIRPAQAVVGDVSDFIRYDAYEILNF